MGDEVYCGAVRLVANRKWRVSVCTSTSAAPFSQSCDFHLQAQPLALTRCTLILNLLKSSICSGRKDIHHHEGRYALDNRVLPYKLSASISNVLTSTPIKYRLIDIRGGITTSVVVLEIHNSAVFPITAAFIAILVVGYMLQNPSTLTKSHRRAST